MKSRTTALSSKYVALWSRGEETPDVFAFLAEHAGFPAGDKLSVLLVDQVHRWQTRAPLAVEGYLARLPELATDEQLKLELIAGELRASRSSERPVDVEGLVSRFPELGARLRGRLSEELAALEPGPTDDPDAAVPVALSQESSVGATVSFRSATIAGAEKIGRYQLIRLLGEGSFGHVWLARDEELDRLVAIKVPAPERFRKTGSAEQYLQEARNLARLDHPNIVPVHDVGHAEDGSIYVISKYIEGGDLAQRIAGQRPSCEESVELMATIAGALHHAHQRGMIHRDIKPANILIDEAGAPYLADFGLALREEDFARGGRAGTPAYMSPEQVRGEGHRLDRRSDIFSLGIVFYELLTGRRPFRGSTRNELATFIIAVEPPAPRAVDSTVPAELERICLKALAKRADERYATAQQLADDLLQWMSQPPQAAEACVPVVPKGLRSFGADDAGFFLELLPGPRDRDGLPESIGFWKSRIEETDPEQTFTVGLIYGPSGCGKSSLVKAGLLPRLAEHVVPVYIEATAQETEVRLEHRLRRQLPGLPDHLSLSETFAALRRTEVLGRRKVLVVLDQFEQWLHTRHGLEDTHLVDALRQCDGGRVQSIVMVRDDFSMAASRFMKDLETRIVEGHNFATVDLFDLDHAHNVLARFGQAFGKLPADAADLTDDEERFLTAAVTGLSQDQQVICVHLALFAEMVKNKPWTPATLERVGGTAGIGVTFLEETFNARDANPDHRAHEQAARHVLKALLPEYGSNIKGHMRSHAELLEVSGGENGSQDFFELLRILDGELRLITPTDPEGAQSESGRSFSDQYYQLTHDFLVPALREWLTRKQKETARGRAELCLAERAATWSAQPENRWLPSLREWATIHLLTRPTARSEPEQKTLRRANRYYVTRGLVALLAAALLGWGIQQTYGRFRAAGLVEALCAAETTEVPSLITRLNPYRRWANPALTEVVREALDGSKEQLHARLALLPVDPGQVDPIVEALLGAEPASFPVLRGLLSPHGASLSERLWQILQDGSETAERRFRAAGALAVYDPQSPHWQDASDDVAGQLVAVPSVYFADWARALRPVGEVLLPALCQAFRDEDRTDLERSLAAEVLADYVADRPEMLVDLACDANARQFKTLFPQLQTHGDRAITLLEAELAKEPTFQWNDPPLDPAWTAPDATLVSKIERALGVLHERFAFCQTMPLDEFISVAQQLAKSGYRPTRFRPYPHRDILEVAAVWTRDGQGWRVGHDLTAEEIRARDAQLKQSGFMPADVTSYRVGDDDGERDLCAGLWIESDHPDGAVLAMNLTSDEDRAESKRLREAGYWRTTCYARSNRNGGQLWSSVWTRFDGDSVPEESRFFGDALEYFNTVSVGQRQADISISKVAPQLEWLRELNRLDHVLKSPPTRRELHAALLQRAKTLHNLGRHADALSDLDQLADEFPGSRAPYPLRAVIHAQLGQSAQARQALGVVLKSETNHRVRAYTDAVVSSLTGDDVPAMQRLEAAIAQHRHETDFLVDAACAYGIACELFAGSDPAKSRAYGDRALALVKEALEKGYANYNLVRIDPDLARIRALPGFANTLTRVDGHYTTVRHTCSDRASTELHGLELIEHLSRCRQLSGKNYRPVSLFVTQLRTGRPLQAASVWEHLIALETAKDQVHTRQANAGIALLRLGQFRSVRPLLMQCAEPQARSWLIHRARPLGVDIAQLLQYLRDDTQTCIRRALLHTLGEFDCDSVQATQRESCIAQLWTMYREDPDAGIHGAAEWVLRRWGQGEQIKDIERKPAVTGPRPDCQWFLTSQGHTMVIVRGPVEFQMGSPRHEEFWRENEKLHRVRIDRSFAIASKETTVEQFQRFLQDNAIASAPSEEESSREYLRHPQTRRQWYHAAAYCNWLSRQEGIPEVQFCYVPDDSGQFCAGMQLATEYLSRVGYRLPTEAEWEYACRATTTTSRYYGYTEKLLGHYAWYGAVSAGSAHETGLLKPNDIGLFDMHGNVWEWCQEHYRPYRVASKSNITEDREDPVLEILDDNQRALRGGSLADPPMGVRSAARNADGPRNIGRQQGFRVARTIR